MGKYKGPVGVELNFLRSIAHTIAFDLIMANSLRQFID